MHSDKIQASGGQAVMKANRFKLGGVGKIVLFVVILAVTTLFCAMPDFHPESYFGIKYVWWLDMIFHGGYYFVITILLYIVFCKGRYKGIFWIAVLLSSYFFEILQSFVPGRSVTLLDMISNFLGITLATILCSLFYR